MWFFGALLDWNDERQPTSESIGDAKALRQGTMHIDSIRLTGPMVLGNRPLSLDAIEPWLCINGNAIQRYVSTEMPFNEDTTTYGRGREKTPEFCQPFLTGTTCTFGVLPTSIPHDIRRLMESSQFFLCRI
jgi:hypothetical protein